MAAKFKQSGERHVPFFDSIMEQELLRKNTFAFSMENHNAPPGEKIQSELTFGYVDPTKYTGEMIWHDVVLPVFWSLNLDRVTLSFSNPDGVLDEDEILLDLCSSDSGSSR